MKNHGLHFVSLAEKLDDLIFADLIIMLGGCRPEFYFFELRTLLMFALLVCLLIGLIEKFPLIGDVTDRRFLIRLGLHQVYGALAGHPQFHKRSHQLSVPARNTPS